ncbi:hypothetical protein [Nocardioides marmoriginsengisoli]|uniref:hypothetical protein n=1 Tax=Nocardioides marmoriginsengisoli TaxID=661483 RepID=UPI00161AFB17|nr:hypothetical protein [Nocardioides marmoriginsengisoli]
MLFALGACSGAERSDVASVEPDRPPSTVPKKGADAVEAYLAKQKSFVACVRKNGFPAMQDPDEFGGFVMKDFMAMEGDLMAKIMPICEPIIDGVKVPQELVDLAREASAAKMTPAEKKREVDFAHCMQENGVPEYPDPHANGLPAEPPWQGFRPTAPTPPGLERAHDACLHLMRGPGDPAWPDDAR